MAFVNRATRTINTSARESNEVGPGQYFTEGSTIIESTNNAPFNSNTSRPNYYKGSDSKIGPGSYEPKTLRYQMFHISKPKLNKNLYKAIEENVLPPYLIESIEDSQKIGFSTKTKRFGQTKQQLEDFNIPGPGHYKISSNFNQRNTKKNKPRSITHNSSDVTRQASISTIPTKDMYGYEFKEGKPVLIPNPYIGEQQINADQYDLSPKWTKNFVSWNRTSLKNNQWLMNNDSDSKNVPSIISTVSNDNHFQNRTSSDSHRTEATSRSIVFKIIMDKRNSLYQRKQIKSNTVEDFVFNSSPGPGYYASENNQTYEKSFSNKKNFQSFGSTSPRFDYRKNDNYKEYNEKKRHKPKKFLPKLEHLFTEEEANFQKQTFLAKALIKEQTDCNISPGSYDVSKSLIKNKKSPVEEFGSKERRFNEEEENVPGPGAYINPMEEYSMDKHPKLSKMISAQSSRFLPSDVLKTAFKKNGSPSPGSYNPEIVTTINYKVLSKINQFQDSDKVGFNVQDKRFDQNGRNDSSPTLGPGLYFKSFVPNIDNRKTHLVPFNHGANRFNYKIKESFPSPGAYDISSFHDWNKKTHNILFV